MEVWERDGGEVVGAYRRACRRVGFARSRWRSGVERVVINGGRLYCSCNSGW